MINISKTSKKDKKKEKGSILLEGELTLKNAAQIKQELILVFSENKQVDITLKNIENVDLACLQLFYSLGASANKLDKKITFNADLSDGVKILLDHSGLTEFLIGSSDQQ